MSTDAMRTPMPNRARDISVTLINALHDNGTCQSCLNCSHFLETGAHHGECMLAKQTPPPRVIVYGCEKWEFCPF